MLILKELPYTEVMKSNDWFSSELYPRSTECGVLPLDNVFTFPDEWIPKQFEVVRQPVFNDDNGKPHVVRTIIVGYRVKDWSKPMSESNPDFEQFIREVFVECEKLRIPYLNAAAGCRTWFFGIKERSVISIQDEEPVYLKAVAVSVRVAHFVEVICGKTS